MNFFVLIPVVVVMALMRLMRVGLLTWVIAWWLALYIGFSYGLAIPAPQSVITMYMAIVTLSLAAYVGSSPERTQAVLGPLVRTSIRQPPPARNRPTSPARCTRRLLPPSPWGRPRSI